MPWLRTVGCAVHFKQSGEHVLFHLERHREFLFFIDCQDYLVVTLIPPLHRLIVIESKVIAGLGRLDDILRLVQHCVCLARDRSARIYPCRLYHIFFCNAAQFERAINNRGIDRERRLHPAGCLRAVIYRRRHHPVCDHRIAGLPPWRGIYCPAKYLAEPSKVVYRAKDGTEEKVFDALKWLAAMCSHIPDRGEQMVRY